MKPELEKALNAVEMTYKDIVEIADGLVADYTKGLDNLIKSVEDRIDKISNDEIDDFIRIQEELEKISITVETLQLWAEKMLVNGIIDPEAYRARKQK